MTNLEIINEILDSRYKSVIQDCLSEENIDNKGKKFSLKYNIVKNYHINYELFRYDNNAFPFFREVSLLKKMCDYILFAEEKNTLYVFVIELKSSNESAKKQLDAAVEFVNYIINTAKRIGKEINNYKIRKIRICDNKIKKRNKLSVEKGFEFDKDDFCDYKFKDLHLEPLMD
jgi:hypothetical protein